MTGFSGVAALALFAAAGTVHAAPGQACKGGMAYVEMAESRESVSLLATPAGKAPAVADVHRMQYICVLTSEPVDKDGQQWHKVAPAALLKGVRPFAVHSGDKTQRVGNYPVRVLQPQRASGACTTSVRSSDGGHDFRISGNCVSGWVPADAVHYFGD